MHDFGALWKQSFQTESGKSTVHHRIVAALLYTLLLLQTTADCKGGVHISSNILFL